MISKFLLVTALLTQVHTQAPNIATVATVLMHRSLLQYGRDTVTPNAVWDEEIKKEFIQKIEEIFNGPIQRAFEDPSLSSKVNIKIAKRRYIFLSDNSFYFDPNSMTLTDWKVTVDNSMSGFDPAAIVGIPILMIGRDPSKPDLQGKIGMATIGGWAQGCSSNPYTSVIVDGSRIMGNRFDEISKVMGHELGHYFGAKHDDPQSGCESGNHDSLMAANLNQMVQITYWPECVVNGITSHINDMKNSCPAYAKNIDENFDPFPDRWEIPSDIGPTPPGTNEKRDTIRFLKSKSKRN